MICYASSLHIQTALEKYRESFNEQAKILREKFALQPVQKSNSKNAYVYFSRYTEGTFCIKKQQLFFFCFKCAS